MRGARIEKKRLPANEKSAAPERAALRSHGGPAPFEGAADRLDHWTGVQIVFWGPPAVPTRRPEDMSVAL